jgi:hypothetical protein
MLNEVLFFVKYFGHNCKMFMVVIDYEAVSASAGAWSLDKMVRIRHGKSKPVVTHLRAVR